jgi:hypothetical protein
MRRISVLPLMPTDGTLDIAVRKSEKVTEV